MAVSWTERHQDRIKNSRANLNAGDLEKNGVRERERESGTKSRTNLNGGDLEKDVEREKG